MSDRYQSRWVKDGDEWVAVCGPFSEFDYDEVRFALAISEGVRKFENRLSRAGLVRFGTGPLARLDGGQE